MSIVVMGHCPPDTDSTCSPIVYAWFLKTIKNVDAQAYISGKVNKEAEFVLNHFSVSTPDQIEKVGEGDKLVLIDTNNPEELVPGWESAEIIEIVDHHKMYGLKTGNIPTVTIRPYGCVATVIWELVKENKDKLPKEMAGLLLACILSDTLKFTSPTTTEVDRQAVSELASISGVDVDSFATQMFDAKSNLEGMQTRDILLTDAKDFDFGGKIYKLAVLETTNPQLALEKRNELEAEMQKLSAEENLAGIMFFVVDIINSSSVLLTVGEGVSEIAQKAFDASASEDGTIALPGVVSRKKQMVPAVEKLFTESA